MKSLPALLVLWGAASIAAAAPPARTAGDVAMGWPTDTAALRPASAPERVPWLRSSTAARLFVERLPEDPHLARVRLLEAMAVIVARHGRRFDEPEWQAFFRGQDWYRPKSDFDPRSLSQGEQEALDLLFRRFTR